MNTYEYYAQARKFDLNRIMELFQRRMRRFKTQTSTSNQYCTGALAVLEFIMDPAYESLEWEKGDVVKIVGGGSRSGEIGVVRCVGYMDKKTVSIVTTKGDEMKVFGSYLMAAVGSAAGESAGLAAGGVK